MTYVEVMEIVNKYKEQRRAELLVATHNINTIGLSVCLRVYDYVNDEFYTENCYDDVSLEDAINLCISRQQEYGGLWSISVQKDDGYSWIEIGPTYIEWDLEDLRQNDGRESIYDTILL